MPDEIKEESVYQGEGKLTEQEIQKLRSIILSYSSHNHDGRNSQKVATKKVKSSVRAEQIKPNTTAVSGEDLENGNGVRIGEEDNVDDLRKDDIAQSDINTNGAKVIQWDDSAPYPRRGAQSFIVRGLPEKIKSVTVKFGGSGTSWTAIAELTEDDGSGLPGTVLATSASVNPVPLDTDVEFTFPSVVDLDPDGNPHIGMTIGTEIEDSRRSAPKTLNYFKWDGTNWIHAKNTGLPIGDGDIEVQSPKIISSRSLCFESR